MWTIPIVMTFGALGLLVGVFVEPVGKLIVLLCLPFLCLFEFVVREMGKIGEVWGMMQVTDFPVALSIGYYVLVLAAVLSLRKRQRRGEERTKGLRDEIGL